MIFHEEFYLNFPLEEAWEFFSDFPGPIQVIPGATEVRELKPLHYLGAVTTHIGPFSFVFRGNMNITKIDPRTREVVIEGSAHDLSLGGHFKGIAYTRTLAAGPNRSRISLEVHVGLGGLLGKLGGFIMRPKARNIVNHYGDLVNKELGQRRMRRALQPSEPKVVAVAHVS